MVLTGKCQLLACVKMSPFPLFHKEKEHLRNAVSFPYAAKTTGNSVRRLANCRHEKTKPMFTLYRITFTLARKPYWIGLPFIHKNYLICPDFCNRVKLCLANFLGSVNIEVGDPT